VDEVDWGTVSAIAALVVVGCGYLSRQMHHLEARLTGLIDRLEDQMRALTERYIAHLERHAH
jgi:hypothetical protein